MRLTAKTLSLLLFLFCFHSSNSQEGNNWYFGWFAGLSFNTSPPSALTDGAMITDEGCSTISDKNGNLLFYSDGVKVFNRNHQVMPNGTGLMGHISSTQSALIVPEPADTNRYFIFTAGIDINNVNDGYRYSEVDMRLDGGRGDVTGNKNIFLCGPSTERLAAIRHANGLDIWIITKEFGSNRFNVFLVTCSGVSTISVISDVGIIHDNTFFLAAQGQMKVSPDGKKVSVVINNLQQVVELFDFDNATGVLSNAIDITGFVPDLAGIYGTEFSPNSQLLYVTTRNTNSIFQYDISSNNQVAINASRIVIPSLYGIVGLQLGPDNRIYIADRTWTHLSVIASPDNYGTAYNYMPGAVDLNGRVCNFALPSFIAGYKYRFDTSTLTADFNSSFINCSVQFSGSSNFPGMKWYWNFGDNIIDSGQVVTHSYRMSGSFNVTMKAVFITPCGNLLDTVIVTKPVVINNVFAVDFNYNGSCVNDLYQLNDNTILTVGNITGWDWDFADGNYSTSQSPSHTFNTPGAYNVKFVVSTSGICRADSIIRTVYVDSKPVVDFSPDGGCVNQPVTFTDLSANNIGDVTGWNWNFNDTYTSNVQNPVHTFLNYGNYSVSLAATSSHGCSSVVSKPVAVDSKPNVDFLANNGCVNNAISFNDLSTNTFGGITGWNWNFNDSYTSNTQNSSHSYSNYGNYNVTLTANSVHGCTSAISKALIVENKPVADFIFDKNCPETPIAFSDRSTISLGNINNWSWDFGNSNVSNLQNPLYTFTTAGIYPVKLTVASMYGCISDLKIIALDLRYVRADAGPDALAIYNRPYQLQGSGGVSYLWSPSNFLNDPAVSNPLATLIDDQIFNLKVIATNGCTGYDDVKLTVVKKFDIYVPSAFTPNGDGKNDFLLPVCIGIKSLDYFIVYNRWGQAVFSTKDMNGKWDGNFLGAQQPVSTFVWVARGITVDGVTIERKGTSTLIR
jgi:gliding motility-associated-like protein